MSKFDEARLEFEKLTYLLNDSQFLSNYYDDCFKIFRHIYLVNHFKNRVETKKFFDSNFDIAFSLLLESFFALYSGHIKAAMVILRSSQEMTLKSIIFQERKKIKCINENAKFEELDFRYTENKTRLKNDIRPYLSKEFYDLYSSKIDQSHTLYKELSGIVHSGNKKLNFKLHTYFSSLVEDNNNISEKIKLYIKVLKNINDLICFMMRDSLEKWDTYELNELFSLTIKKEKSRKNYIDMLKGKNIMR